MNPRAAAILPPVILVLCFGWVWGSRIAQGGFEPARRPDTISYRKAAQLETLRGALAHYRTAGYPTFLRLLSRVDPSLGSLPEIQAILYTLAVFAFFFAVRGFTGSRWLALLAAIPLPFIAVNRLVAAVLTDHLAASLTLFAVASMLWLIASPRNPIPWITLVSATALTYQVRPTAQLLILWLPATAWVLALFARPRPGWVWRFGVASAALVPYLAFCTLRLLMVGHFGLVSFAGSNLSAASACLVDQRLVRQMPADLQSTTSVILERTRSRGVEPLRWGGDATPCIEQYNHHLWKVMFPIIQYQMRQELRAAGVGARGAMELWGKPFQVERDARLQRLALEIIQRRLGGYLAWVRGSLAWGWRGLWRDPVMVMSAWGLLVVSLLRLAARWGRWKRMPPAINARAGVLAAAMITYALLALLAVSLVSFPFTRYLAGIGLLLPSSLLLAAGAMLPRPHQESA